MEAATRYAPASLARISEAHPAEETGMTVQTFASAAEEARHRIRSNQWRGVTSGVAPGHVQANLAILPRDMAFDFLLFCQRKPEALPAAGSNRAGRG